MFLPVRYNFTNPMLLVLGIASTCLLAACAHRSLSLEEAKQVSVSIQKTSLVPPPRRAYDVVDLLQRDDHSDNRLTRAFLEEANAVPSARLNRTQLATFFLKRGQAAQQLGLMNQARNDLQRAYKLAKYCGIATHDFEFHLASIESPFGNYRTVGQLVAMSARESGYLARYAYMVKHYTRLGDLKTAQQWRSEALEHYQSVVRRYPKARQHPMNQYALAEMEAVMLEAQGQFKEAEPYRRTMVDTFSESLKRKYPSWLLYHEICLIQNLTLQGRLVEAEIESRRAIKEAVAFGGKGSYYSAMACRQLGRILIQQNRLQEARAILEASITSAISSGTTHDTPLVGEIRLDLVEVLAMQGIPQEAANQFKMAESCFLEPRYFTNHFIFRPTLLTALAQAGRNAEALPLVQAAQEELADRLGLENPHTLVMQAVRGMVEDGMGNSSTAAEDYVAALPLLLSMATKKGGDSQHRWLVQTLLEAYLDHLAGNRSAEMSKTAFHIAEVLRHHGLSMAISAYSARGNAVDPVLRDLTRREQDARRQVEVLEATIGNLVAAPADQVDPDHIREVTEQLEQLKAARERILSEIQTAAPRYHNYLRPRSMELEAIQGLLRPKETMLVCHTTPRHTFVWAIQDSGIPRMEVVSAGHEEITALVASVRHSLDATPATLGDIPAFDMAAAHRLYQLLLLPLSDTWGKGQELLVITNAPLDRLPLGVLPIHLAEDNTPLPGLLFTNYRRVDWLIRHAATSRHASVAAFAALRQSSTSASNRKPFAGFGDPIFTLNRGKADTGKSTLKADLDIRERGCAVKVRGVRVTVDGNLDADTLHSTCLRDLAPLPDTAEEVRSIAQALQAPPEKSVFLGADASEARIKTMDLSDRQVIAFATHALLPGDLDGLDQPALALSAPEVTGEAEDGLLTMGEIMTLHLDADLVVISACDTGSASGAGREALSGLGAAFFYAGSRSLLVSLWPVETTSARHLTTGIFARQQTDHRLGRAQALQEAILALMDSPGLTDPRTGQVAASYAHPMFWAPFILVGEGASEGHPAAQ